MISKLKVFFGLLLSVLITTSFFLLYIPSDTIANSSDDHKIKICHSTSSHTNPYTTNSVDKNSTVDGHDGHNGGIWSSDITGDWGDIIPPFSYESSCPANDSELYGKEYCGLTGYTCKHGEKCALPISGSEYAGKNWTVKGIAIWNNDCNIPSVSEYEKCSLTVPGYGEWSDWQINTEDNSKLVKSRIVTHYDSKDLSIVCATETENEYKDRALCEWDLTIYADDDRCIKPIQDEEPQTETPTVVDNNIEEEDTPAVLGTTTVALANTAGGDTQNYLLLQSLLSLSAGSALIYMGRKKFIYIA